MSEHNLPYGQALAEAQAQGFAEADPTLDVEGVDAAQQTGHPHQPAYGARIDFGAVSVSGISNIDPVDLQFAREFGYTVKLLAITREDGDRLEARVHPTLIPRDHMLAGVGGAMNAVYITGDAVGSILLEGAGGWHDAYGQRGVERHPGSDQKPLPGHQAPPAAPGLPRGRAHRAGALSSP